MNYKFKAKVVSTGLAILAPSIHNQIPWFSWGMVDDPP